VYLGFYYPLAVIGGGVVGCLSAGAISWLFTRMFKPAGGA
jgi:hypothetical protein